MSVIYHQVIELKCWLSFHLMLPGWEHIQHWLILFQISINCSILCCKLDWWALKPRLINILFPVIVVIETSACSTMFQRTFFVGSLNHLNTGGYSVHWISAALCSAIWSVLLPTLSHSSANYFHSSVNPVPFWKLWFPQSL